MHLEVRSPRSCLMYFSTAARPCAPWCDWSGRSAGFCMPSSSCSLSTLPWGTGCSCAGLSLAATSRQLASTPHVSSLSRSAAASCSSWNLEVRGPEHTPQLALQWYSMYTGFLVHSPRSAHSAHCALPSSHTASSPLPCLARNSAFLRCNALRLTAIRSAMWSSISSSTDEQAFCTALISLELTGREMGRCLSEYDSGGGTVLPFLGAPGMDTTAYRPSTRCRIFSSHTRVTSLARVSSVITSSRLATNCTVVNTSSTRLLHTGHWMAFAAG
mmetsp:Transcript_17033/g.44210  ORF Transcript_17033/g.44210 Transcript_17033/m.44210 type:complete len:272 (+) Transcript_17033:209-1024(+)